MTTAAPVESKVAAATTSAALATFVVSWLGDAVFHGAVPTVVVGLVDAAVAAAAAFVAGWLARHTPRGDVDTGTDAGPQPPGPGPIGT